MIGATRTGAALAALLGGLLLSGVCACGAGAPGASAGMPELPTFPEDLRTTPPKPLTTLPAECDEMLPPDQMAELFAGVSLDGASRDIVGVAEPAIELTTRTSCYYGMPPSRQLSEARLYVGLALYANGEAAKSRLDKAVSDKRETGAQAAQVPIGKREALLLTGGEDRTLAYQTDSLTLLVGLRNGVAPDDRAQHLVTKVAEKVLRHLGR